MTVFCTYRKFWGFSINSAAAAYIRSFSLILKINFEEPDKNPSNIFKLNNHIKLHKAKIYHTS